MKELDFIQNARDWLDEIQYAVQTKDKDLCHTCRWALFNIRGELDAVESKLKEMEKQ